MDLGLELKRLVNSLEFIQIPCVGMPTLVCLSLNELLAVKEFIELVLMLQCYSPNQKKLLSSILESLVVNKKMILKDKNNTCCLNSQIVLLLKILGLGLTLKGKDLSNSWNYLIKDSFKKLWLPVKTDYADLDTTSYPGHLHKTIQNSWFSTKSISLPKKNSPKTSLPYYKSLLVGGMEKEVIVLRTRKIRLKLTFQQKQTLQEWNHNYRFSYNKAVWLSSESSEHISKLDLRNLITPKEVNSRIQWVLTTPKSIREAAVFESYKNKQACFTNLKNKNIKHFSTRFLSKKKMSWTMNGIPSSSINVHDKKICTIFPRYNLGTIRTCEVFPEQISNESSIHFDGLNYFLCIPLTKSCILEGKKNNIVGCDPGVRTFLTTYDLSQKSYKIGDECSEHLSKLHYTLDDAISRKSDAKSKGKKNLNKYIAKIRIKIKNKISELHNKTINFLCKTNDIIVIPHFGSKEMSKMTPTRKINSKTVRNMMTLSHCAFLGKLKAKAEENGVIVAVVDERNTTKTCGNCYNMQNDIKGKSYWRCKECDWEHDRDCNAARNILLKYYTSI